MAIYKRKRTTKVYRKKSYKKKKTAVKSVVKKLLKQHDRKMYETKHSNQLVTDGTEIYHNNFIMVTTYPFRTTQGTADPEAGVGNRIGDKITCKGYSYKMMVELNERYSDVTFRFMVVKSAKGDTPTRTTMFMGQSGNKMLDKFNFERFSIIEEKFFKLKAPNQSSFGAGLTVGSGAVDATANVSLTRATKIIKGWIPASKFTKGGVLQYENGNDTQLKFYDYWPMLYAYSNYSTDQDLWYIGRLNEFIGDLVYTDA